MRGREEDKAGAVVQEQLLSLFLLIFQVFWPSELFDRKELLLSLLILMSPLEALDCLSGVRCRS